MITAIRVFVMRLLGKSTDPRLDEEVAAHLEMLAREFELKGMSAADARVAARREFGPVVQMREVHRDRRRLPFIDSAMQDLSFALRQLRANPGFLAAAIVTLALGIGANAAVFTVLDGVVLRSLPVDEPDNLAALRINPDLQATGLPVGVPFLRELNSRQTLVEGIFASGPARIPRATVNAREIADPAFLFASGNYFRLLGAHAQLGRVFTERDDDPAAPPVAVISDRFWRRQFAGQPTALGKTIRINDKLSLTVVGVTGPAFYGERLGQIPDAWIPLTLVAQVSPGNATRASAWLFPMARLRKDVPLDRAQAGLSALSSQLMPDFGLVLRNVTDYNVQLVRAPQGIGNLNTKFSTPLWLLMGLVMFVVLITCCNLANLLLARGVARAHEIGVRLAIGASRSRVIRQLLTESLVIAGLGGAIGFALAYWGSQVLIALALAGEKQELMMGPGLRVAGFTILVSIICACLFGVVPSLTTSGINLASALQAGNRTHTRRSRRMAATCFGVAQLGISMLLVAGALLLVSSFWKLLHQDMGYSRDGILTFRAEFGVASLRAFASPALRQTMLDRLNAIPGVQSAALQQGGPLGSTRSRISVALPDRPSREGEELHRIDVSPLYFETMGMRLVNGRFINGEDRSNTQHVAVITEAAARKFLGAANPVGRFFTDGPEFKLADAIQVVGVARDVRFSSLREPFEGVVFTPMTQTQPYTMPTFVLKTGRYPMRFAEHVKQTVRDVVPNLRVERIEPWDEVVGLTVRNERLLAWLSGGFGLLAIILASVGAYGVVAYGAERSIQEIGIRLALGARPYQLRLMLLREIGIMLVFGVVLGSAGTLLLGRWIRSILFDLPPHDPITLGSAVALLTAVVLLAAYLPARAARLDPLLALRQH